jgi:hypothetical protein
MAAGRHGAQMRAAIGWYNVTWTLAVGLPLLVMPFLGADRIVWSLGLCGVVNLVAMATLGAFPLRPGHHESARAETEVGAEYPWLARSAAVLLPVSYVIQSTLSPLLPDRLQAIGVPVAAQTLVAAIWMVARFITLVIMSRSGFWHGRWGTLAAGALGLVTGLCAVLMAGTTSLLVAGLVAIGAGLGLTYYAALYYSMAVGQAAVDAGGNFEALIGLGYTVGPLLGLGGAALGGVAHQAQATVAFTWFAVALAAWPGLRPYLAARRGLGQR